MKGLGRHAAVRAVTKAAVLLAVVLFAGACSSEPPPLQEEAIPPPLFPSVSPSSGISIYPVPSPHSPRPPKPPTFSPAPYSPVPFSPAPSPTTKSPSPTQVVQALGGISCGATQTETIQGVTVVTNTTCFDVSGSTMQQLQASIDANGPKVNDYRRAGATRWKLGWNYSFDPGPSRCGIADPTVKVTATYLLPRWTNPDSAKEPVRKQWIAFAEEVKTHEAGHRDIAVQAGVAALGALNATPASATCGQTETKADARVRAVMAKYRLKQQAYDASAAQGN
jgi:predicted secreted Zn-dependent protease